MGACETIHVFESRRHVHLYEEEHSMAETAVHSLCNNTVTVGQYLHPLSIGHRLVLIREQADMHFNHLAGKVERQGERGRKEGGRENSNRSVKGVRPPRAYSFAKG